MAPNYAGKRKRPDRFDAEDPDSTQFRSSPNRHNESGNPHPQGRYSNDSFSSPHQQRDSRPNSSRGGYEHTRGGRGGHGARYNTRGGRPSHGPSLTPAGPTAAQTPTDAATPRAEATPTPAPPAVNTDVVAADTPSAPLVAVPPKEDTFLLEPLPFTYVVMTQARLDAWSDDGQPAVAQAYNEAVQSGDDTVLGSIFQEILRTGLDGRMEADQAGSILKQLLEDTPETSTIEAPEVFFDTLSALPERYMSNSRLQPLVAATGLSAESMRLNLDDSMLKALSLTRDTFSKMFIRKQTHILYRQSNYNLMREETEGYAKLMTELFTVSQPDDLPLMVVSQTLENVKALIGAFDLDAGRVLDVTLDVFANVLVKKTRFFVKLLRASPFWPQPSSLSPPENGLTLPLWALPDHPQFELSDEENTRFQEFRQERDRLFWNDARSVKISAYFALGNRKILDEDQKAKELSAASEDVSQSRAFETAQWVEKTGTAPPSGNAVAAQLLGFKLRFYSSRARDKDDSLNNNLIWMAALLIKIGFISLRDLYTHLYPTDDKMNAVKTTQETLIAERNRSKRSAESSTNALARASALSDDTLPVPAQNRLRTNDTRSNTPARADATDNKPDAHTARESEVDPLPEPEDQKVELLKSLLLLGALPEALYILGRFPWLLEVYPDLPKYIYRLLHYSIERIYEPLRPLQDRPGLSQPAKVVAQQWQREVSKGNVRLVEQPVVKTKKWANLEQNDANDQGPGNVSMQHYYDDWVNDVPICQTMDDMFTLCDTLLNLVNVKIGQDPQLLTKLALIGKHSLAEDQSESNKDRWINLMKRILCPAISFTEYNCGSIKEVWDLLKMFPTETRYTIYAEWFQGPTSRLPAMVAAFSEARAATKYVLKRIDKDNVKTRAKDLAKQAFSSPGITFDVCLHQIESYDNLIQVIIDCARFFSNIACDVLSWTIMNFLGREGRSRLSQTGFTANKWLQSLSSFTGRIYTRYPHIDTLPMLRFIFDRIRTNNFVDLRILRDLITNMAGIAADLDYTEDQLLAMAGGDLLRRSILRQLNDQRHVCGSSAKRLMKVLVEDKLAGPILVAIAQQRETCIFTLDQDDTKILGETFDEVVVVLTQYSELLNEHLSAKEFGDLVPSVADLMSNYGLEASTAFTIHRKSIAQAIIDYDAEHRSGPSAPRASDAGTLPPPDNDLKMADATDESVAEAINTDGGDAADKVDADVVMENDGANEPAAPVDKIDPANGKSESTTTWHPILEKLNSELETVLPENIKSQISIPFFTTFWQLDLSDIMAHKNIYDDEHERLSKEAKALMSDPQKSSKTKDEARRIIEDTMPGLTTESRAQIKRYSVVRNRLRREMEHWFKGSASNVEELHLGLLQDCFLPRLSISPIDAQYAQRMLFYMHELGVPGFRTCRIIPQLLNAKSLANIMFQATRREADNLGRFLYELLKSLAEWHADQTVYETKAHGPKKDLPGFALKIDPSTGKPEQLVDYQDFRRVLRRWHQSLFNALTSCIASSEYMHVRNGIQVLTRTVKVFPAIRYMGEAFQTELQAVGKREKNKRDDLSTAAFSALGLLKPREKKWVKVQEFAIIEADKEKPQSTKQSQDSPVAEPADPVVKTQKPEHEDGEVQDGKAKSANNSKPTSAPSADSALTGSKAAPQPTANGSSQNAGRLPTPSQQRPDKNNDGVHDREPRPSDSLKRKPEDTREGRPRSPAPSKRPRLDESTYAAREDTRPHAPERSSHARRSTGYRQGDDFPPEDVRGSGSMHPPSMPRSDRPQARASEAPRSGRQYESNYGRLNHDPDASQTANNETAGRLSRPENLPPPERRTNSSSTAQSDRSSLTVNTSHPPRGPDSSRADNHGSAPSTPAAESASVHPSRLQHIEDLSQPRPPSGQAGRLSPPPPPRPRGQATGPPRFASHGQAASGPRSEYHGSTQPSPTARDAPSGPGHRGQVGGSDSRQLMRVRDTILQNGPPGPSGANSAGQRSGGHHNSASSPPGPNRPSESQPRFDDARSNRDSRDRPGPDQQSPAGVNPGRAAVIDQDTWSSPAGRAPRDQQRYGQEGFRSRDASRDMPREGPPSRTMTPNDRGGSVRGHGSSSQMDDMSGSQRNDRPTLSRGPSGLSGPDSRDGPSYGSNYPPPRQHHDDRMNEDDRDPNKISLGDRPRGGRDDMRGPPRPPASVDSRQGPPPRDAAWDSRDTGGRPPRGAYDDAAGRGGERPQRRGPGREVMSEGQMSGPPRYDGPPRDGGYGRADDGMAPRQDIGRDMRGGVPPRRGGGASGSFDNRSTFQDTRRGPDNYGRDRRDGMNGGGPGRKREWEGDGPQGGGKRTSR